MTSLIFDTETDGLSLHPNARIEFQPRILEFGCVLVDSSGDVIDEFETLINPGPIPDHLPKESNLLDKAGIMSISGIDVEILKDQPRFEDVADKIKSFFARADQLIAHNLPFDRTMMELELQRAGIEEWPWPKIMTCTAQEHQEEWGRRPKLLELYEHYTGKPLDQKHRALDDVKALLEVCKGSGVLR